MTKEQEKVLKPIKAHIIVEAKPRKGHKIQKDSKVIPPSDYFVVEAGESQFLAGQEVIFGASARLTPVRGREKTYIVHSEAVIAFYE